MSRSPNRTDVAALNRNNAFPTGESTSVSFIPIHESASVSLINRRERVCLSNFDRSIARQHALTRSRARTCARARKRMRARACACVNRSCSRQLKMLFFD